MIEHLRVPYHSDNHDIILSKGKPSNNNNIEPTAIVFHALKLATLHRDLLSAASASRPFKLTQSTVYIVERIAVKLCPLWLPCRGLALSYIRRRTSQSIRLYVQLSSTVEPSTCRYINTYIQLLSNSDSTYSVGYCFSQVHYAQIGHVREQVLSSPLALQASSVYPICAAGDC